MLEHIELEQFTAFEKFSLKFSSGLNVFIGENGCGKTHLLKLVYAACDVSTSQKSYAEKLNPNRDVQPKKQAAGHCYDVEDLHAVGAVHAKPQYYPQG